jgi:hypothetical protein
MANHLTLKRQIVIQGVPSLTIKGKEPKSLTKYLQEFWNFEITHEIVMFKNLFRIENWFWSRNPEFEAWHLEIDDLGELAEDLKSVLQDPSLLNEKFPLTGIFAELESEWSHEDRIEETLGDFEHLLQILQTELDTYENNIEREEGYAIEGYSWYSWCD